MVVWFRFSVLALMLVAGCNSLSGAEQFTVADDDAQTSSASGTQPPLPEVRHPAGLAVSQVLILQGPEKILVNQQYALGLDPVPVVAGRSALFRIVPLVTDGYDGQPVQGVINIDGVQYSSPPAVVTAPFNRADPESTLNVQVPGDAIGSGSQFRVDVVRNDLTMDANPLAGFPRDPKEVAPLGALDTPTLTIEILPIRYQFDGSGRLPVLDPPTVQRLSEEFYRYYPISGIEIRVATAIDWNADLTGDAQTAWTDLLTFLGDRRAQNPVAGNVYQYAMVQPTDTLAEYCAAGPCIYGLANVVPPFGSASLRTAIGIGFAGAEAEITALHELGHNHGRAHVDCGAASDPDLAYPYADGAIETWGYDVFTGFLQDPSGLRDVMGYCDPVGISAYTYRHLHARSLEFANASLADPPELTNLSWQRVALLPSGMAERRSSVRLPQPMRAEAVWVDVATASGRRTVTGQLVTYDHIEGGLVYVPASEENALNEHAIVRVTVDGRVFDVP